MLKFKYPLIAFICIALSVAQITGSNPAKLTAGDNPRIHDEPLPEGVHEGITYKGDNSIILTLFAPYKSAVYVIGDFTGWLVDAQYLMNRYVVDPDSIYWWLQINNLSPAQEYAYQYLVDGSLRIADPYAEKVLDPWNDQYISSETYPGLKQYPTNKTSEPVSVFRTNKISYAWLYSDSFVPPAQEQLVIYELLMRDFVQEHDYKTVIDTLSYFEKLGINAIELMPVTEFEGNLSWGYNPSFYFAPDKYYGPANDLKRLIDQCHRRGIAVIMDMVLNHSYGQCPLVRLYFDSRNDRPTVQNPWYNTVSPNPVYAWGYDFDHTSPATQKFVDRVVTYWLTEYQIDGFRFDFTKGFTNTPGDGMAYDTQRIGILERLADKIWSVNPDAYVILEHFTDNSEERVLSSYGKGMIIWGKMNSEYNEATMGYNEERKSDFSWGYAGNRQWPGDNLVTYMESHDEERLMFKNLEYGNHSGSYNVQDLPTALDRIKLACAFFLTYPGPKMIWQFGEVGYDYSIDYNGRTGEKPIRWDYYTDDDSRRKLFSEVAQMIKLHTTFPTFYSNDSKVEMDVRGSLKQINLRHAEMNAVIIGNFDVTSAVIVPQFNHNRIWYDYLSGDSLTVIPSSILLQPGEFHIYTDLNARKLIAQGGERVKDFLLEQNFPNPFNSGTTILYKLPAATPVTLDIYNTAGRHVARLINRIQPAGSHTVIWNGFNDRGKQVASGLYIYRLQCRNYIETRKMLLIR